MSTLNTQIYEAVIELEKRQDEMMLPDGISVGTLVRVCKVEPKKKLTPEQRVMSALRQLAEQGSLRKISSWNYTAQGCPERKAPRSGPRSKISNIALGRKFNELLILQRDHALGKIGGDDYIDALHNLYIHEPLRATPVEGTNTTGEETL